MDGAGAAIVPFCFCCLDAQTPLVALECACAGTSVKHAHPECLVRDFQRRGEFTVSLQNGARFVTPRYNCPVCEKRAGSVADRELTNWVQRDIATWNDGREDGAANRRRTCATELPLFLLVAVSSAAATAALMYFFVYGYRSP